MTDVPNNLRSHVNVDDLDLCLLVRDTKYYYGSCSTWNQTDDATWQADDRGIFWGIKVQR